MLIFPTLFLFVYLIYETAKLSREKIRHQFAMDAAVFVETVQYSDFLNRTAYINGAFPMRIFAEAYSDQFTAICEGKTTQNCQEKPYRDVLYDNGAFPRSQSGKTSYSDEPSWDIAYNPGVAAGESKNGAPPTLPEPFELLTLKNAEDYYQQYEVASEIYKFYVQIYSLLGSVEAGQKTVLLKLTQGHTFLSKSYWLNTGDAADAGQLVANYSNAVGDFSAALHPKCLHRIKYCGNKLTSGLQIMQAVCSSPDEGIDLDSMNLPGCEDDGGGLFQLEWVDPSAIDVFRQTNSDGYPGLSLTMNWAVPQKNYWNVDFPALLSQKYPRGDLHTTISLIGDPATHPSVWPDPTPKFQVRQFP